MVKNEKEKAIKSIKEKITQLEEEIRTIENIQVENLADIDEELWHALCETPLRNSEILCDIVKAKFPEAENIKLGPNQVVFELLGFKCEIPTTRCYGINVCTDWYVKDLGKPTYKDHDIYWEHYQMYKYFQKLDEKADWYTLVKLRYRHPYYKHILFFIWFFWLKWKDPHRDEWEKKFEECRQRYEEKAQKYYATRKEMKEKAKIMKNELIPILDTFSTVHCHFSGASFLQPGINNIIKWEEV